MTRHIKRRLDRRRRHWAGVTALVVLIGLAGMGCAAVLSGRYQVRPVLSGSMRPGLPVGGVVITKRVPVRSLHVRDVVVFHPPGRSGELVVHRIVSIRHDASGIAIKTQGDANNAPDPWEAVLHGSTAYRAVYSLPLVGYVAVWMHNPLGRRILMLVGLVLIVTAAASSGRLRRRTRRTEHLLADDPPEHSEREISRQA